MQNAAHRLHGGLLLHVHVMRTLLTSLQPQAKVIESVLYTAEARIRILGDRHWLSRGAWLGWAGFLVRILSMDKCVARGSALDLAESNQVAALEISIAVLELPQRSVWVSGMEHVADCPMV